MNVWVEAARPRTLPASIVPVLVGTAAAGRVIAWRFFAALAVALALQVGVNYANDYFDALRGVDTAQRAGPRRAVASGLVSPASMRTAMVVTFGIAAAAGVALAVAAGPELLAVGLLALAAALGYSGGPRPYGSAALGEVFVFVFFGLVATAGSSYVQLERLEVVALAAALPVGLLATALLVVNNLRDIPTDRSAGKTTVAVRIGAQGATVLFRALIALAFASLAVVAVTAESLSPLIALAALPVAARPLRLVSAAAPPPKLIEALGATSALHLTAGVLLAAGLWIAR